MLNSLHDFRILSLMCVCVKINMQFILAHETSVCPSNLGITPKIEPQHLRLLPSASLPSLPSFCQPSLSSFLPSVWQPFLSSFFLSFCQAFLSSFLLPVPPSTVHTSFFFSFLPSYL